MTDTLTAAELEEIGLIAIVRTDAEADLGASPRRWPRAASGRWRSR